MKLLVTIDLKDKYINMIKEAIPEIRIVKSLELDPQKKEIIDADFLITGGETSSKLLLEAEKLKLIQTWSAGVEEFIKKKVVQILKEKDIKLLSMSGIHGDPIAEHVMGFIINFSRRLYEFYEQQKEKKWERLEVGQLAGKTMVIVGTGSIGQEIARKAKAFKMKTLGVKRDITKEVKYIDHLYSSEQLKAALKEADYIVVTVPLTEETREMFSEKEFAVMKETAFFVNIARGGVVNEGALINALKEKVIAGAGLDVFTEEPLASESPFYSLKNVYITPHISGAHPDYNLKATELFIENLQSYLANEKINNLVDYTRGY